MNKGLREMYDELPARQVEAPKTKFVNDLAELCKVHPKTVRCWIYGTQQPDALRKSMIAKHLGISENKLFTEN